MLIAVGPRRGSRTGTGHVPVYDLLCLDHVYAPATLLNRDLVLSVLFPVQTTERRLDECVGHVSLFGFARLR